MLGVGTRTKDIFLISQYDRGTSILSPKREIKFHEGSTALGQAQGLVHSRHAVNVLYRFIYQSTQSTFRELSKSKWSNP